jgi:glycine oxidase
MLAPVTEVSYGEESLAALAASSAARWPAFARELSHDAECDPGYTESGTLLVGIDGSDRAHLQELHTLAQSLGLSSELVGPSAARELEPLLTPSNRGGVFASGDAAVDNRRLLAALGAAGASAGVQVIRGTVQAIATSDGRAVGVESDLGRIEAGVTVLAAGFQSVTVDGRVDGYRPPTRPVKGQILRLQPPSAALRMSRTVRALVEGFSVYIVARADGRVVVGATQEEVGVDERTTAGGLYGLLRDGIRVIPSLGEYEVVEARAAMRPGSPDNAAIVGESPVPGLLVATGHHRNGILHAPVTAELISSIVLGRPRPPLVEPFDPRRFAREA